MLTLAKKYIGADIPDLVSRQKTVCSPPNIRIDAWMETRPQASDNKLYAGCTGSCCRVSKVCDDVRMTHERKMTRFV